MYRGVLSRTIVVMLISVVVRTIWTVLVVLVSLIRSIGTCLVGRLEVEGMSGTDEDCILQTWEEVEADGGSFYDI